VQDVGGDVYLGLVPGNQSAVEPNVLGLADGHDSTPSCIWYLLCGIGTGKRKAPDWGALGLKLNLWS